jgi:hypothetical protein
VKLLKRIYDWIEDRVEMHDLIKKEILDKPVPKGLNLRKFLISPFPRGLI